MLGYRIRLVHVVAVVVVNVFPSFFFIFVVVVVVLSSFDIRMDTNPTRPQELLLLFS